MNNNVCTGFPDNFIIMVFGHESICGDQTTSNEPFYEIPRLFINVLNDFNENVSIRKYLHTSAYNTNYEAPFGFITWNSQTAEILLMKSPWLRFEPRTNRSRSKQVPFNHCAIHAVQP